MGAFGVVELQGAGERVEDAGGDSGEGAAFELGVVLDAHPGQRGDLAAPQPGDPALPGGGSPACSGVILARREVRNSRTSARLSTSTTVRRAAGDWDALSVHPSTVTSSRAWLRVCLEPWSDSIPLADPPAVPRLPPWPLCPLPVVVAVRAGWRSPTPRSHAALVRRRRSGRRCSGPCGGAAVRRPRGCRDSLADTPAAREFAAMLPATLDLRRHDGGRRSPAGCRTRSRSRAPHGHTTRAVGDIYYWPRHAE